MRSDEITRISEYDQALGELQASEIGQIAFLPERNDQLIGQLAKDLGREGRDKLYVLIKKCLLTNPQAILAQKKDPLETIGEQQSLLHLAQGLFLAEDRRSTQQNQAYFKTAAQLFDIFEQSQAEFLLRDSERCNFHESMTRGLEGQRVWLERHLPKLIATDDALIQPVAKAINGLIRGPKSLPPFLANRG
jgi:hypothetical protein